MGEVPLKWATVGVVEGGYTRQVLHSPLRPLVVQTRVAPDPCKLLVSIWCSTLMILELGVFDLRSKTV